MENIWCNVFKNLGFKQTKILGRTAFEVPIYKALYMNQLMGPDPIFIKSFKEWERESAHIARLCILTDDGKFVITPPSVKSIEISIKDTNGLGKIINPMFTPSIKYLKKIYPDFFNSDKKYLVFYDKQIVEDIKNSNFNLSDFILFKPERDFGEDVMEYIASCYMRKIGYIVDKFDGCLITTGGASDLVAIKFDDLQNKLIEFGIVESGFYLNELELIDLLGKRKGKKVEGKEVIVLEAESEGGRFSQGKQQIFDYMNSGCYDRGYVIIAFEDNRIRGNNNLFTDGVGLITIDKEGNILIKKCEIEGKAKYKEIILKEVERIVKLTLLKNLPLKEIGKIFSSLHSIYELYYEADKICNR